MEEKKGNAVSDSVKKMFGFLKDVGTDFTKAITLMVKVELGSAVTDNLSNMMLKNPFVASFIGTSKRMKASLDFGISIISAVMLTFIEGHLSEKDREVVTLARESMMYVAAQRFISVVNPLEGAKFLIGKDNFKAAQDILEKARGTLRNDVEVM